MSSAGPLGGDDFLFVPTLVTLLRNRRLKGPARKVLVGYGEAVVDTLAYFMRDRDEDIWVRRHMPSTLARIPSQASVDALVGRARARDGFLRYKAMARARAPAPDAPAAARCRRPCEQRVISEANRVLQLPDACTTTWCHATRGAKDSLLARALEREAAAHASTASSGCSALVHPWTDIAAARWTLEHGDGRGQRRARSSTSTTCSTGQVRKRVMPLLEDMPLEEKVRTRQRASTRRAPRDVEDSLAQLVHDDDQVVAAAAIQLRRGARAVVARRRPRARARASRRAATGTCSRRRRGRSPRAACRPSERRGALAGAAAGRGAGRSAAPPAAVRLHVGRRAVPHRRAPAGRCGTRPAALIYEAGTRADDLQFLLDGAVTRRAGDEAARGRRSRRRRSASTRCSKARRAAPRSGPGIARSACRCRNEQFLQLLSENTELAQGIFRMLLERSGGDRWGGVARRTVTRPDVGAARGRPPDDREDAGAGGDAVFSRAPRPTTWRRSPASRAR